MGLFWPESTQDQARNALSQALHVLRRELGEGAIVTRGEGEVALSESAISVDVWALETAMAAGDLERVVSLYRGSLLSGFAIKASAEFDQWLDAARNRLARAYADSLEQLASAATERGERHEAVVCWRRSVEHDPYSTHVTMCLMRALDAVGDRAGALEQAECHTELLRAELAAEPSPDVVAYAERLRREPLRHVRDHSSGDRGVAASLSLDRLKRALADRYTIERAIGSGGMAIVFLADDLKHERKVAVKVLRPELAATLGAEQFHQEIKIAAQLTHPHILTLIDSGDADGFFYYVMPYIEGESLRDKLAHEGELGITEAVRILRDVVDALSEAHEKGVVHRDIKPDNVLLTKQHALVTDFGVAKAVSHAAGRQQLTTAGVALGTPEYMSPEQATADPHVDHRADIYGVGAVAYELLTGRPPFLGTTPQMILSAHMTDHPEAVTKYRESVPPELERLVMKCLEKKAADRWQSAEELLPHLEALARPSRGITPVPVDPVAKRRWIMAGAAAAVAVIIAVAVVVPRGSRVTLDRDRVLVAVFDNQTGDPSLDPLGAMAGNWITQGLQQSRFVQVVPWLEAQQASRYVASQVDLGNVRSPVTALAEETGAGTVISGAYYRRGETVQYQVEVTDVTRGRSLGALDPEIAPLDSPDDAIEPMRQHVMGLLAISFDERVAAHASSAAQPPSFEAYRAFDEGMVRYLRGEADGFREAFPYFHRAFELDTTFVTPLFYAILVHSNIGQWTQSDSLVGVVARFRDRLSDYDQHWLDYLRARVEGDNPEALRAIRRAAELAPSSKAVYNWAHQARHNNRPREALDALLSLDPERGPMRGWRPYFEQLVGSYSALDEHESALEATQQYREIYGDDPSTLGYEAGALAALGRVEEVNTLLDDLTALPEQGLNQGEIILGIALDQRRLGHIDAAQTTVDRAIRWFDARLPETKSSAAWRWSYAWALYIADRRDEAYSVATSLSEEFPEDLQYRGFVGVLAACRGDQEEAQQISQWLESLDRPYLRGNHTMWRSRIAGTLGDGENAVALFRQAVAQGMSYPGAWNFSSIPFEPLRDYPPWQELIRPKG
jgi:DNA-binding SARP family transcriptional activator